MRLFFLQKFHFLYILYNVLKGGRLFRVLRTKKEGEAMKKYELTSECVFGRCTDTGSCKYFSRCKKFKFATFYRTKDEKVMVYCGDFNGNLEGFREWTKKTFDGKIQKEYLTIADFMEQHFAPE